MVRGRGDTAATSISATLQFNNDTGANYDRERVGATSGSVTAAASVGDTSLVIGNIAASTATAAHGGGIEARIFDYRGTTFQKMLLSNYGFGTSDAAGGQQRHVIYGAWRDTSAITEIDVILAAGNFDAGSVVSLYGIL